MFLLATAGVAHGWGRNHLNAHLPTSGGRCWLLAGTLGQSATTPTCSLSNVAELPPNIVSWFKGLASQKRKKSGSYVTFMT